MKTSSNRTIWNGVVTPRYCGKKVLAIRRDTFFIVAGIVQRTYAVCYGFLIAVIHAKCNATETELLVPIRWVYSGAVRPVPGTSNMGLGSYE